MSEPNLTLFAYWRTSAGYRVRVALALKGLKAEERIVNVDAGEHRSPEFLKINPLAAIPAMIDGDGPPLTQSLAILEYLEETHPAPALLPSDPRERARARSLADLVACDTHPLYVPRVRNFLMEHYGLPKERMMAFVRNAMTTGLKTLEKRLSTEPGTGRYCQGDAVSHADLCLVSLWVGTAIFEVDTAPFPTAKRIAEDCLAQEAFAKAHPKRQPGAPQA